MGLPVIGDLKSKGFTRGSSLSKRRTFIVEKEDGPDMIYLFRLALPPLSGSYSPLFEGKVFPFRFSFLLEWSPQSHLLLIPGSLTLRSMKDIVDIVMTLRIRLCVPPVASFFLLLVSSLSYDETSWGFASVYFFIVAGESVSLGEK